MVEGPKALHPQIFKLNIFDSSLEIISQGIFKDHEEHLRVWECGIVFSHIINLNPGLFNDQKILELGCGSGITGISILKFTNCKNLIFSDYKEEILTKLEVNLKSNSSDHLHSIEAFIPQEDINLSNNIVNTTFEAIAKVIAKVDPSYVENNYIRQEKLNENCALCGNRIKKMLIDWTAEPKQELIEMGIDLIIGTDVIYKGSYPLKLADFLAKMGCKVILIIPDQREVLKEFLEYMKIFFDTVVVEIPPLVYVQKQIISPEKENKLNFPGLFNQDFKMYLFIPNKIMK